MSLEKPTRMDNGPGLGTSILTLFNSLKIYAIIGVVLGVILLATLNTFGYALPEFLHGLVDLANSTNLVVAIFWICIYCVAAVVGLALLIGCIKWAFSHMRGLTFVEHIRALAFSLVNTAIMAIIARTLGYLLVRWIFNAIDFTVIPADTCMYSALVVAVYLFFNDYRMSASPKYWIRLLLMHVVYAVLASFGLYALAVMLLLSLILPLFKVGERYTSTWEVFCDSYPGSREDAGNFADAAMHSSVGWMSMLFNESKDE